jgi:1-phosphatidylinositol-4-phosphate 5-kinase
MERKNTIFSHLKENKAKQKWHVNQMGEVIYKGHQSFSIMKQIQMGLKQSVLLSSPKDNLVVDDFKIRLKQLFPSAGDSKTPPHDFNDFLFYTYASPAFRNLRERFGISQDHFLVSLCQDKSLAIIGTPGKSGSLFFFSLDMQYILKTITKKESKAMREILPAYYNV